MEDASLDDFLDAGDAEPDDGVPDDEASDDSVPDDEASDDSVPDDEAPDNEAPDNEAPDDTEDSEVGEAGDSEVDGAEDETAGEPTDDEGVEVGSGEQGGVTATYRYDPSGAPCSECGETVTSRWHDGDALVCATCKPW